MHFTPGELLSPNLRLVRKLRQGGMGTVWVAEHATLNTQFAVKFLSAELALHSAAMKRFTREATIAARLKHPHVVQIHDHGVSFQGLPYIAMELLEGEDLADRLQRTRTLSPTETCIVVSQTCRALAKAHSLDLVHRDIKPDNIFLTEVDGELFVKILDFGVAKNTLADAGSLTTAGALIGTPRYMSPEQIVSARDVDPKADLWSVAAVAYECLVGRSPFDAETIGGILVAVSSGVFVPPSSVVPGLGAALDNWFLRAFALDPASRFSKARELADTFSIAATGVARGSMASVPAGLPSLAVDEPQPRPDAHADSITRRLPVAASPRVATPGTFPGTSITQALSGPRRLALVTAGSAVAAIALIAVVATVRNAIRASAIPTTSSTVEYAPQPSPTVGPFAADVAADVGLVPDAAVAADATGPAPSPIDAGKPPAPKPVPSGRSPCVNRWGFPCTGTTK
jgi:eukaryotic-like serine/threonine-protein kinase